MQANKYLKKIITNSVQPDYCQFSFKANIAGRGLAWYNIDRYTSETVLLFIMIQIN